MARAAVRPAAPVRLGRGGEPPGLISPSGVFPSPEIDKLLLWTAMSNPDDDTDVPSGFNDDAEMERTPPRASETSSPQTARPFSCLCPPNTQVVAHERLGAFFCSGCFFGRVLFLGAFPAAPQKKHPIPGAFSKSTQKKHPTKKAPNNGCFFSASWRLPWAP